MIDMIMGYYNITLPYNSNKIRMVYKQFGKEKNNPLHMGVLISTYLF